MKPASRLVLLALLCVALASVSNPVTFAADPWAQTGPFFFTTTRVCRDGADVTAAWDKLQAVGSAPAPGDTQTLPLSARYWLNASVALSQPLHNPAADFGPLLTPPAPVALTFHATPLNVPTAGNAPNLSIYGNAALRWTRLLPAGRRIVLYADDTVILDAQIGDCLMHGILAEPEATTPLRGDHIPLDPAILPPEKTVIKVLVLPSLGDLYVNGDPVITGQSFTLADVQAGRVRYKHEFQGDHDQLTVAVSGTTIASRIGNANSFNPSMSADGFQVAFDTLATNLVADDANNHSDVVVLNRLDSSFTLMSRTNQDKPANGDSYRPSLSGDGKTAAFVSYASDLRASSTSGCDGVADTNGAPDIYLAGTQARRLSVGQADGSAPCTQLQADEVALHPSLARDTIAVGFGSTSSSLAQLPAISDTNGAADVFLYANGNTSLQSLVNGNPTIGNGASLAPALSADGMHIAFDSTASNLVGDDTNNISDIFLRDIAANTTTRISVASGNPGPQAEGSLGSYNPSISADGRSIAFESYAENLIKNNFGNDQNHASDIFVRDLQTNLTLRMSLTNAGGPPNGDSRKASISGNGRFIAYESDASNIVPGDVNDSPDIFVVDRDSDEDGVFDEPGTIVTTCVSMSSAGVPANGGSFNPSISSDGSFVAFESDATNIVAGDTNGARDIFVAYTGFRTAVDIRIVSLVPVYLPLVIAP